MDVWNMTEKLLSRPSGGVNITSRAGFTRIVNQQLLSDLLRLCIKCQITQPIENYSKNKASYDGYLIYCRDCDSIRRKELYYRKRGIHE